MCLRLKLTLGTQTGSKMDANRHKQTQMETQMETHTAAERERPLVLVCISNFLCTSSGLVATRVV